MNESIVEHTGSDYDEVRTSADTEPVTPQTNAVGSYFSVDGLNLYYEILGTGSPLILLHGGLTTIDTSFGMVRPSLAKTWQTIAR